MVSLNFPLVVLEALSLNFSITIIKPGTRHKYNMLARRYHISMQNTLADNPRHKEALVFI